MKDRTDAQLLKIVKRRAIDAVKTEKAQHRKRAVAFKTQKNAPVMED